MSVVENFSQRRRTASCRQYKLQASADEFVVRHKWLVARHRQRVARHRQRVARHRQRVARQQASWRATNSVWHATNGAYYAKNLRDWDNCEISGTTDIPDTQ